jgi:hypothetical protein
VTESSGATILLAVIALSAIVQAVLICGIALGGRKLTQRIDELQGKVDRDIRPALANLSQVTRNVAEASDLAVVQVRRIEGVVGDTLDRLEDTRRSIQRVARVPLLALGRAGAVMNGFRRGFDVYRQLGSLQAQGRGRARSYREDEHLFI